MNRQKSKIIRNRFSAFFVAALLFAVQILSAAFCFAEEYNHEAVRSEMLYITVPQSWQVEEFGSLSEDEESIGDDELVYKILEMQNQDGVKQGEMWICAEPYNDAYYYCSTKEDAEEYLDNCGDDAIEAVIEEVFPDADSWTRSNLKYLKGEDAFTYIVRQNLEIGDEKYLLYLDCEFTTNGGVHEVLLFKEPYDKDVCDRIGESLEGFSYATELIDNRVHSGDNGNDGYPDYYFDNDTEHDMGTIINAVIWILIWVVVITFVVRRVKGTYASQRRTKASTERIDGRPNKKHSHRTIDKWTLKQEREGECTHEDMHIQTGARYSGYHESLKTLHKSGLLTTKEMNELLEKHKNDI